ncbi:hypothetical protein [Methylobacterium tarhaniae]|uniref:hypothetical protein n=1 Tax=Methylobacterium tarhaniae TaxID=1187852 RepID=UPI003CFD370D
MPAPITAEHWREALVFMASVVESYGDVYAPVLEEVERRYEAALRAERPRDRARRILETYTRGEAQARLGDQVDQAARLVVEPLEGILRQELVLHPGGREGGALALHLAADPHLAKDWAEAEPMRPLDRLEHGVEVAEILVGGGDLDPFGEDPLLPPVAEIESLGPGHLLQRPVADDVDEVGDGPQLRIAPLAQLVGREVVVGGGRQALELGEQRREPQRRRRLAPEHGRHRGGLSRAGLGHDGADAREQLVVRQLEELRRQPVIEAEAAGPPARRIVAFLRILRLAGEQPAPVGLEVGIERVDHPPRLGTPRIVGDADLRGLAHDHAPVEGSDGVRHAPHEVPDAVPVGEVIRHPATPRYTERCAG